MSVAANFQDFLSGFFKIFASKGFRGEDYLSYLQRPENQRGNDEASIVDNAIVSPLLRLLGFEPGEQVYNLQRQSERPDFAPSDPLYGTCFMVEDKNTSLSLTNDLNHPGSHLSQLVGYMRSAGVHLGWLTNGRQLTVWKFEAANKPVCSIAIDLPSVVREWRQSDPPTLSANTDKALQDLFDLCRKASFSDPQRLEYELAKTLEEWQSYALPLGTGDGHEGTLVESLQIVVKELQRDARRVLDDHLMRYAAYSDKVYRLTDDAPEHAAQVLKTLREKVLSILIDRFQIVWSIEQEDLLAIEEILIRLERDDRLFMSPKELLQEILRVINTARQRKPPSKVKTVRPMASFDEFPVINEPLQFYIERGFAWRQRQATLRHDYRTALSVYDDYTSWRSLVQETMLGTLNEEKRRDEFALQAAYVVFIRLLLIRVCEDKGVFPNRFISDGGLKNWQADIKRYYIFAKGNPYQHLLEIAYENAQNIYAHFFTGRELFNWYQLDRQRFIMTLYQLSRFNFAEVDSDIIGTIYNTYVNREEKRNKGQYYTPAEIIHYILDTVGYSGKSIIGPSKRLIDPACGSGSFLVTAAKRLIAAYQDAQGEIEDPIAVLNRVQQNLYGFDLNPFACYLAEINLLIQVLDLMKLAHAKHKDLKLERFHIYNVDALARPSGIYYHMNINTLQAEEQDQVNQIKSRQLNTSYAQGFAFVVANPPYGAALSDEYKETLRANWADVFYGQPDTYTFFLKLGLDLLARNGKLGFITPNTYLMGKNTAALRFKLLTSARIEQIVDLPQGIWNDANVDCILLFLTAESDEARRKAQQVQVHLLGLRDTLDKLTHKDWSETLIQQQARWLADTSYKITTRYDDLLHCIEEACYISINDGSTRKLLQLGDITESTQGIIPYFSKQDGERNLYIKACKDIPSNEPEWKPVLDGTAFIGRYELRWGKTKPYIKYGKWLYRPHEAKFFESPKLLVQDMRNRALKRRLVATFDNQKFYNRHNFSDIIAKDADYDLKYILALFNSSLLNYWFSRQFDNLHINPSYFRQLPIFPADAATQQALVALVDEILTKHASLNALREQGYLIREHRNGQVLIEVPYDHLLQELHAADQWYPTVTLFDAATMGMFSIPATCDLQATISNNIYIPTKYPTHLVLRHNKLWLDVSNDNVRRYLLSYLKHSHWQGRTWNEIKNTALIPENEEALHTLFALEEQKIHAITALLHEIKRIDTQIDEHVLDLYGILNGDDRQRILGSAPIEEEDGAVIIEEDDLPAS